MGTSLDELAYLINLMEAREQQACFQNHIPLLFCNFCGSKYHSMDACPILFDTSFIGMNQFVGVEDNSQFQQHMQSLKFMKVQPDHVEQIVSIDHQIQENKMSHDNVQPVAPLEVMQCDTSLDDSPGEPIKTLFASSHEHKVNSMNSSECVKEITPQNALQSDLDELHTSLEVDKSSEIFACECGVCNVCLEINVAILGEEILIPAATCADFQENSVTIEFDTKSVDLCRKQPLSIAGKMLVEPLIKPPNMPLSFTICIPILSGSQANYEFCDFYAFVSAGSPYVLDIPPKPPDFVLIYKYTCYLLFPISCIRSVERRHQNHQTWKLHKLHLKTLGCVPSFTLTLCLLLHCGQCLI